MANTLFNDLMISSGYGPLDSSITNVFKGIDHRKIGSQFQKNTDHVGLVLFTKPDLNLSHDNVTSMRILSPMVKDPSVDENADYSLHRALRLTLSPRLTFGINGLKTKLIDTKSPFISLMSNTLLNLSGWNDITLDYYTSHEGKYKEAFSIVDSIAETNGVFTMTGTWANIEGDPLTTLLHYWTTYMGGVFIDDIKPWPSNVIANRKDYETRIWRLVLDKSQRYVRKIASCIAFPTAAPISLSLNYNRDNAFNNDNDQLSIPFACQAQEYNDPILYEEFNLTVQSYNPLMRDGNREQHMIAVDQDEIRYFNFDACPWIDPLTLELKWFVDLFTYQHVTAKVASDKKYRESLLTDNGYISELIRS